MSQILHQQDSDPIYYEQPEFVDNNAGEVFHGFFSRRGGVSTDFYASLNCGQGSDDDLAKVHQNRKTVGDVIGCDSDKILSLHQVHSADCVTVDEPWEHHLRPRADAFVTARPGIGLGILTADCGPVLFYGRRLDGAPVVGAAHAGWGGALKGVLESTMAALLDLGAEKDSLKACIGPCIGKASYEVQDAFSVPFLEEDETAEKFFLAARKEGHLMFDLAGYCAFRLARAGFKNVFIKDLDTYFNEEDFFSYRRTTHRHEKDYGRQMSVIIIPEKL